MAAIVFDLDGTLVDSAPDIADAANLALAEFGLAPLPLAQLTSFIGHGIPSLVGQVIAVCEIDPARTPEMNASVLAHYSRQPARLTRPYAGVSETLAALQGAGHTLGVCTNKFRDLSTQILDALDLSPYFDVVIGGDSLPVKKPDPAPLLAAFAALPGTPLCYVGDSEVDAQTADAARLDFALFTQGYRKAPIHALRHSFAFDRFDELLAYVASHD
ncbi:MAG: phosphoglycolate phosphatase [Hyphomicrobiales bacterium]